MAFKKSTFVSGYISAKLPKEATMEEKLEFITQNSKSFFRRGHADIAKCIADARKKGFVGEITIKHCIFDNSGKGRGGHDGKYQTIGDSDEFIKLEEWQEGRTTQKH